MKRLALIFGLISWSIVSSVIADPAPVYEKTPLPPGPILKKVPNFAAWQIAFSYAAPKSAQDASGAPSPASDGANAPGSHLPKLLTITRTNPRWHSVLVDVSGDKKELWFDGATRFEVGRKESDVIPISSFDPGFSAGLLDCSAGPDFPDVEWLSPGNYLGTQKGTTYWVFQHGPDGATVWVDSNTHFPVRWQKGLETRDIHFLDTPSGQLTLPPNIVNLSKGLKQVNDLSRAAPPHL